MGRRACPDAAMTASSLPRQLAEQRQPNQLASCLALSHRFRFTCHRHNTHRSSCIYLISRQQRDMTTYWQTRTAHCMGGAVSAFHRFCFSYLAPGPALTSEFQFVLRLQHQDLFWSGHVPELLPDVTARTTILPQVTRRCEAAAAPEETTLLPSTAIFALLTGGRGVQTQQHSD